MNRTSFLLLGIGMLGIFAWEALRIMDGALSGLLDLGRMMSARWTLLTAAMLLTWFCFKVTMR